MTKVLLYGTGIISKVVEQQLDEKKVNIVGYIVDEAYKSCDYVQGKKVYLPYQLLQVDYDYIIVCVNSAYLDRLWQQLLAHGVSEQKILFADIHDRLP